MTEKARKIFDILGVEPVEEFRIVRDGMLCRFSGDLTLQCRISDRYFEAVENVDTYRKIISGETKIIKIPKLKSCPFCGSKDVSIMHDKDGFSYVTCHKDGCMAHTDGCLNDEDAIKHWNRRVELQGMKEFAERLKKESVLISDPTDRATMIIIIDALLEEMEGEGK